VSTLTTKSPHVPFFVPMFNPVIRALVRRGIQLGPKRSPMVLLTIRGRKSGTSYTNPVNIFHLAGRRYVFATFGETSWVKNLRTAKEAELTEGGRHLAVDALELRPEDAAPVLREALTPFLESPAALALGRYYSVRAGAPLEDFVSEARRHAVFELREPK
jgi:deazaflavin-dependent oxidoreductase (nitroreductase family)